VIEGERKRVEGRVEVAWRSMEAGGQGRGRVVGGGGERKRVE